MNIPGSFECVCPDGHELTPDGNACKGKIMVSYPEILNSRGEILDSGCNLFGRKRKVVRRQGDSMSGGKSISLNSRDKS